MNVHDTSKQYTDDEMWGQEIPHSHELVYITQKHITDAQAYLLSGHSIGLLLINGQIVDAANILKVEISGVSGEVLDNISKSLSSLAATKQTKNWFIRAHRSGNR